MDADERAKFEKLPKWALAHMKRIEGKLEEAELKLAAMAGTPSNIMLEDYGTREKKLYLPEHSTVTFITTRNGERQGAQRITRFRVRIVNNGRDISVNADDTIGIKPSASNDIVLVALER